MSSVEPVTANETSSTSEMLSPEDKAFVNGSGFGPLLGPLYYVVYGSFRYFWLTLIPWMLVLVAPLLDMLLNQAIIGDQQGNFIPLIPFSILSMALLFWSAFTSTDRGRRIAWDSRSWVDFEQFKRTQQRWDFYGIIFLIFVMAGSLLWFF